MPDLKRGLKVLAVSVALVCAGAAGAQSGETVSIAMIEGLSGPQGVSGVNQVKTWRYLFQHLNAQENPAGVKFELVAMDSKGSPQEALGLLRRAEDEGLRYIVQGNGSHVAIPLSEAIEKFNARNPGREMLFIDYAAVDPALTNEKCSYWHFRVDADTSMKMKALAHFMRDQPEHSYYLINQNYSHGHQVSEYFKRYIAREKPEAQIVGDEYTAIGQVKDFAPYVAKIKASGAEAIVTGSWGQDFTLLAKALGEAGLNLPIYSYYASSAGTPKALPQREDADIYQIWYGHSSYDGRMGELMRGFKAETDEDFYMLSLYNSLVALSHAMAQAGSTDPVAVAAALEEMRFEGANGTAWFRKADHQLQQGLWISKWQKVDADNSYSVEDTGYTFAPVKYIPPELASTSTTCEMHRPG